VRKDDLTVESTFKFGKEGEDRVSTLVGTKKGLFVATYTAPADIVEMTGYTPPTDCQFTMWSEWGHPSAECGGKRTRTRRVRSTSDKDCKADLSEMQTYFHEYCDDEKRCKAKGLMFTPDAAPQEKTCKATCWDPNPVCLHNKPKLGAGCVCPPNRPLAHFGKCVAATTCPQAHMRPCSSMSCKYNGHHVRVLHHRHEHNGNSHICRHSRDMLGGCHCMCFNSEADTVIAPTATASMTETDAATDTTTTSTSADTTSTEASSDVVADLHITEAELKKRRETSL
jgi:hypothetical protein